MINPKMTYIIGG